MTKAELVETVASKVDLPRAVAERAVNTVFDEVTEALKNQDLEKERPRFQPTTKPRKRSLFKGGRESSWDWKK